MGAEESDDRQHRDEAAVFPPGGQHVLQAFLARLHDYQIAVAADRQAATEDRQAAAEDRKAAARDRELAAWARQQAGGMPDWTALGSARDVTREPESGTLARSTELNIALRFATVREAEALEFAEEAAALAARVADSEQRIAESLRELAGKRSREQSARRLALADEAVRGAGAAMERGARLHMLADQAKGHLERVTLRTLLSHASSAFAELARAERAIAGALELLAEHEEAEAAAVHRGDAERAAAAAEEAQQRSTELHRREMATL